MVPTKGSSFFQELAHRVRALVETSLGRGGFCHHDDVCVVYELGAVCPVKFAQVPLHTVAHDRSPNFSRYGKANLPALSVPPGHVAYELASNESFPTAVHGQENGPFCNPLASGKCIGARHNRVIPSCLCRQPFPASCPATSDDVASARGCHACAESVIPCALN